ncbi:hypothetical protein ACQP1G_20440 [Nocardia sp. CA-107356]|uniref:hypothetical protein n=1 Tax=Nocardia sp. CA-107356 TaxID=3239972 RepID=UPI003D92683D
MNVVLSLQNRFRVAVEVDAAAVAVKAAALVGQENDVASARSRLRRAERAIAALDRDGSGDLSPGQSILWVNTFGANSDEPIGILEGRIVAEAVPLGLLAGPLERRYLATIEGPRGYKMQHLVREDDVIAVSDHPHTPDTQLGQNSGAAIADLLQATFGDEGPDFGTADADAPPPQQSGPSPDYGLDQ